MELTSTTPKVRLELAQINCPYIQVRAFETLSPASLLHMLQSADLTVFRHIQVLLKFSADFPTEAYKEIVREFKMISLVFHSTPETHAGISQERRRSKRISYLAQVIHSCQTCGIINKDSFVLEDLKGFIENMKYNGCLNRKISIDETGHIRNCPSMKNSYGNIRDSSLLQAVDAVGFKEKWNISKDRITICRDCEFRYACSDCRAYLENPEDAFSKPLKCGYDPYSGKWNQWSEDPARKITAKLYGIEMLIREPDGSLPEQPRHGGTENS